MKVYKILTFILLVSLLTQCTNGTDPSGDDNNGNGTSTNAYESGDMEIGANEVVVHELSDPDKLNPITSTSANALYIQHNLFMYLLDIDKDRIEIIPSLAKEMPVVTKITDGEYAGGMSLEYTIRDEAKWDNGEPVTGHDVDFSYKTVMNPHVDAEHHRPYLDFIDKIVVDEENPKKITFYSYETYFAAIFSSGGIVPIISPSYYDPLNIMVNYTFQQLKDPANASELEKDVSLRDFATEFHEEKYQRENGFVMGCGPYALDRWQTKERIVLTKKENWWGEALKGETPRFEVNVDKIVYEIITDWTTAVTSLKDRKIDVARNINAKDFNDLEGNDQFQKSHNLFTPEQLSYVYVGMNMKHPIFGDKLVRQAFNHLINKQRIIDIIYYGYAKPISGPFHPRRPYYKDDLNPYDYSLQKAKELLAEAGWEDTDGDGILDKVIDGVKTDFSVVFKYNAGNEQREKIGLFLKEDAAKVGVQIEIVNREWSVYLDEVKAHDFDMFCLGWVMEDVIDDPKQVWYTESYNGGSNYVGFGDAHSDQVIDKLRTEIDDENRGELYKELQTIVNEEAPYIFIVTTLNRLTISKRFNNAEAFVARPGYDDRGLRLLESN